MHCDGNVSCLIPEFIECGLDFFDPLMPAIPEMNPYRIIPQYSKHLAFHGTIDVQDLLLNGTPEQIQDEVRKQIETFRPYGGFFLCSSHCIQPDTPVENIIALYKAV